MILDYEVEFEKVIGLTEYRSQHDVPQLFLKPQVEDWAEEQLGYVPLLIDNYFRIARLRFRDEQDEVLFRINFARHYLPAALHFIPFKD